MARYARRYDNEPKLNIKKVIAVAFCFILLILIIIGINKMLHKDSKSITGKIENVYYYTIYDNGKWGVIDSYGDKIIEPKYDEMIVIPNEAEAKFICTYDVNYQEGKYKTKIVNEKEKEIIKDYDKVEAIANYDKNQNIWYEENVLRVEKDNKYGLVNNSGKKLLECEYDNITALNGVTNSLLLEKSGTYGISDDLGNIIIEPKYNKIEKIGNDYKNGYIVVDTQNKYGIIGFDKKVILENKYESIKNIKGEETYAVKENGKYILINKDGNKVLDKQFADISEINKNSIIAAESAGSYGVVNISGNTEINFEYDELIYITSDCYIAKKNGKYGVIKVGGEIKLPISAESIKYIEAGDFIVADYKEQGKVISKIYNSDYEEKLSGIISEINTSKGYIRIYTNEDYKYYNFKFEEKSASQILTSNKIFLSKKNGKYGFIDASGNTIVDYIYEDGTEQNASGYAGIKKDGVWGAIDLKGSIVVEPKYNLDKNEKIDFINKWHLCEDKNANYYLDK